MDKTQFLDNLNFGNVDSESENQLDKVFIQTKDFLTFLDPKTSIIIGAKGSGKSALYRFFTEYEKSARQSTNQQMSDIYIVNGTGFKDVPNMDYSAIYNEMQDNKIDFQSAWNMYIMYRLVYQLYEKEKIISGENSKRILIKQGIISDKRVFGWLSKFYEKFIGEVPDINELSFSDISIQISKNKRISAISVLKEVNKKLSELNKTVWVLVDKIDELFSDKFEIRKKCIEGLFLSLIDFQSRYANIKLKLFIRSDIWEDLNFVNKSHLQDKQVRLSWNTFDLKFLVLRRASTNEVIKNYILTNTSLSNIRENIDKCFYSLFAEKAYPGEKEANIIDYMIDRITDGQDGIYPRELINFCNESVKAEKNLLLEKKSSTSFPPLLSGNAVRNAFLVVSKNKVETYLSEFEHLKEHFKRFEGQSKFEFDKPYLLELMKGLEPSRDEMIRQLYEVGILRPNSSAIVASSKYTIPRLFRPGLKMVIKGRP